VLPEALISPEYLQMQRDLHRREGGYGRSGAKSAVAVKEFAAATRCKSILDYGCGEGFLKAALLHNGWRGQVFEYDPAVYGRDEMPAAADLVCCTDVLEHIEPEKLSAVLEHIHLLARKHGYFVISTRPAGKTLSDGRNAHLIVQKAKWWKKQLIHSGWAVRDSHTADKEVCFWLDR
jgi:SAM-dependent methyltransferase